MIQNTDSCLSPSVAGSLFTFIQQCFVFFESKCLPLEQFQICRIIAKAAQKVPYRTLGVSYPSHRT